MKKEDENNLMKSIGDRNFYHELFSLAIPIGLQNLLVALIGATDALMLGRLSQNAVAAVSLANQIAFLMSLFLFAVIGGGGVLLAQYWGRNESEMVKNIFCMVIKWTFGISMIFFLLAMLIPKLLMRIYTADLILQDIGAEYLRVVSFSYLFLGVTQCYYLIMKLEGKANQGVIISVVTLIVDVLLDYFLIYGLAGAPKLGSVGSAYSTVVVEMIALIWCIAESYRKDCVHIDIQGLKWFSADVTQDLFRVSLPMLSSSLAWGLGFSMHSFIMGRLGSDATAAASIASIAQENITCICKGVAAGAGMMTGKLLGQNHFEQAKHYGRKFCHVSYWVGGIHMLLLIMLTPVITDFFVLSDTSKHYLTIMLIFGAFYVWAYAINTVIVCGIFPAGGDSRYDATSVFFASWCFALPLALLGTFVFKWPVLIVYIIMCADEIVKLPWIYPRYKKYLWLTNLTR